MASYSFDVVSDFDRQELVNTLWAFATVRHKEERLFVALAAAAAECRMGNSSRKTCDYSLAETSSIRSNEI